MSDYISRQAAIEAVDECTKLKITDDFYTVYTEDMKDMIADIPAADVRENVRGEWEHWGSPFSDESEVIDTIVCSVCGARFIEPKDETKGEYNYCPNCGAEMRGEQS